MISSRRGAALVVCALAVASSAGVAALTTGMFGGASVSVPAERGVAFQATATLPPPPGCERVIVIGDSLMDNSGPWLRSELRDAGYDFFVDAQPSRRIPERVGAPYSGVRAARAARATFGEADCWVVALGSNDLVYGGGDASTANSMVTEMLAAVSPASTIWWVNVNYHRDPQTRFDFVAATETFNQVVAERAEADLDLHLIDWYSLSEPNRDWFFDPVHVDRAASIVRAEFTVAALASAAD